MNLQLKVVWLENFLGCAINQTMAGKSYPVTSYYFWPRTEAWDLIKLELEAKPWITDIEKVKILNKVTEIMNYWKQNRTVKNLDDLQNQFPVIDFVTFQK